MICCFTYCDCISHVSMCISFFFFFFKQKTAYEMRISDWSSDVCSSDLLGRITKLLDQLADRFGTFCALYSDLAGCPIHLYACVLIQRLDGLRDFADATATTHTRNIQAEHLSHLISSADRKSTRLNSSH